MAFVALVNRIISIVDDDPDTRGLFPDALQTSAAGSIFTFTDPTLALKHFKINKSDYALVLSDLIGRS
jgi:two-component system, cell cycle response regulator CpdR